MRSTHSTDSANSRSLASQWTIGIAETLIKAHVPQLIEAVGMVGAFEQLQAPQMADSEFGYTIR